MYRQHAYHLMQSSAELLTLAEKLRASPLETAAWYLAIRSFRESTSRSSDSPSLSAVLTSPGFVRLKVTENKCSIFRQGSAWEENSTKFWPARASNVLGLQSNTTLSRFLCQFLFPKLQGKARKCPYRRISQRTIVVDPSFLQLVWWEMMIY